MLQTALALTKDEKRRIYMEWRYGGRSGENHLQAPGAAPPKRTDGRTDPTHMTDVNVNGN